MENEIIRFKTGNVLSIKLPSILRFGIPLSSRLKNSAIEEGKFLIFKINASNSTTCKTNTK